MHYDGGCFVPAPAETKDWRLVRPSRSGRPSARQCARQLRNRVIYQVRVSLGGAVVDPNMETDYDALKHWASAALAEAKRTGRNRCVCYSLAQLPFEQAG